MLKAEIKGIGIPDEGTPQGGINFIPRKSECVLLMSITCDFSSLISRDNRSLNHCFNASNILFASSFFLSPLLANIVLNELDWWIASQWQYFKTNFKYTQEAHQYRAMKKSKLKEIFIVRYADDFKIASQIGSNTCFIHCCINLSSMQGIPNGRFFPFGFAISFGISFLLTVCGT